MLKTKRKITHPQEILLMNVLMSKGAARPQENNPQNDIVTALSGLEQNTIQP